MVRSQKSKLDFHPSFKELGFPDDLLNRVYNPREIAKNMVSLKKEFVFPLDQWVVRERTP